MVRTARQNPALCQRRREIWGQIYFFFFSRFGFVDLTGRSLIVASIVRSMWRDFGALRGIASTRLVRSPTFRKKRGRGQENKEGATPLVARH